MTTIEWTKLPGYRGETWNPTLGCRRAGRDCTNCYAARWARRTLTEDHAGLTELDADGVPRFNGVGRVMPARLETPLRWRSKRSVFVNSMSDLFLPEFSFEYIAAVFGIISATPEHVYMVLTKHPDRAAKFFEWVADEGERKRPTGERCEELALRELAAAGVDTGGGFADGQDGWPLGNLWLGTSAGGQPELMERLPQLLECPAAIHFLSAEPLLERMEIPEALLARLDWVIAGGESGPKSRVCDLAWARALQAQCSVAMVPYFFKQAGARVIDSERHAGVCAMYDRRSMERALELGMADNPPNLVLLRSRKGADLAELPEDLRVQQFPEVAA